MNYGYFNGETLEYKDINLHISDLQLQRGYGIFDYFRCRDGNFPWLNDYTDRLFSSIELADLNPMLSRDEFNMIVHGLQRMNGLKNGAFKVIVTGGYSENLESVTDWANVIILNIPWYRPPTETFEKGVNLISCEFQRPHPEIKTLNYFTTLKLQKKMREFKAVDVLYHTDLITECSRANVFFISGGIIYTPAKNILNGITRKQILKIFPEICAEDIEIGRLYEFDEMFLTSTSRDVTPVVAVEGRKIGNGKPGIITREIMEAFSENQSPG